MKRLLIAVAMTTCLKIAGQSCDSILMHQQDKFTKEDSYQSQMIVIENKTQKMFWHIKLLPTTATEDAMVVFSLGPYKKECLDDRSKVTFLFSDNSTLELSGHHKFNCDGIARLYFNQKLLPSETKNLKELSEKKAIAVRVKTYKTSFDYDLTDGQSSELQKALICAYTMFSK